MATIPITNLGPNALSICGRVVPPGETLLFDAEALRAHPDLIPPPTAEPSDPPLPETAPQTTAIQDLREQSVATIKEALPFLQPNELRDLLEMEESADKPRTSLVKLIGEALLARASQGTNG